MKLRTLGVIPARYGAQRFPGKPLVMIAGKPLIQHVYEQVVKSTQVNKIIIATEDERVVRAVKLFGGEVMMTSPSCASGTDRVAEVARQYESEFVVNIQGDEPMMRPEMIDQLVAGLRNDAGCVMATLARRIDTGRDLQNPNVVKVVFSRNGNALYFSRYPIPFVRDSGEVAARYKHLGIYAYRRGFLQKFVQMPQLELEKAEKLEQLRTLENGYAIKVLITPHDSVGVDTPEDVELVERILTTNKR
ncbi:MAG: 3-deoxy-manno-octulosonate cytidylyltransferase [Verrucomicrobiia bacterium]